MNYFGKSLKFWFLSRTYLDNNAKYFKTIQLSVITYNKCRALNQNKSDEKSAYLPKPFSYYLFQSVDTILAQYMNEWKKHSFTWSNVGEFYLTILKRMVTDVLKKIYLAAKYAATKRNSLHTPYSNPPNRRGDPPIFDIFFRLNCRVA